MSAILSFREPSHVGIATVDIDDAIARLTPQFGVEWEMPRLRELTVLTPTGVEPAWFRVAHCDGPMSIELLQGSPGSIWHTDRPTLLHHYAYRSDDFDCELAQLIASGWHVSASTPDADGRPSVFAYLDKPGHPRIEIYAHEPLRQSIQK